MWTPLIHLSFGFFDDGPMPASLAANRDKLVKDNGGHATVVVWGPKESRALIASRYPWALEKYDGWKWPIQRSDMSRYAILHAHGGVYVDLDYAVRVPMRTIFAWLDTHMPGKTAFVNQTPNTLRVGRRRASNSMMVAKAPGHPFWVDVLRASVAIKGNGKGLTRYTKIMSSTGPALVTSVFYKRRRAYPGLGMLPSKTFNPCGVCERGSACAKADGVLAVHENGSSWHSGTARVYNHLYCNRTIYYVVVPIVIVLLVLALVFGVRALRCKRRGHCKPCN